MDSYEGYLERRERGELTLSERFDDWIRGRNNPPSEEVGELTKMWPPTLIDRVVHRINRLYDVKLPSWSEEYYAALADGRTPRGRAALYGAFRSVVEAVAWLPDRASIVLHKINNWAYDRLLDVRLRGED